MKHVELITLQGAIEKVLNGLTIQIQSLTTGQWYEPATIVELANAIQEPRPIRIKPEPVFMEVAFFKHCRLSPGHVIPIRKGHILAYPKDWVRVSDWTKVEIKDET